MVDAAATGALQAPPLASSIAASDLWMTRTPGLCTRYSCPGRSLGYRCCCISHSDAESN